MTFPDTDLRDPHSSLRSKLLVHAVLILLPFILLSPFLLENGRPVLSRSELGTDYLAQQLPYALLVREAWVSSGHIPVWQTALASGGPVAGNPSFMTAYPPYWLILPIPVILALNLLYAGHLALAGVGTYHFTKHCLATSQPAALISGVAFMMSPKVLAHVSGGHLNLLFALAWLPYVLYAIRQVVIGLRARAAWLGGLAFSFMAITHAPFTLLSIILFVSYAVFLLVRRRATHLASIGPKQGLKRWIVVMVGGALGAAFGGATHILPFLSLLGSLNRQNLGFEGAAEFTLPAPLLLTAFTPPLQPFPEWVIYAGAIVTVTAVFGALCWKSPEKVFWLAVIGVSLLYSLGASTPVFPFLYELIPGLDWIRVPTRAWFFVSFGLAILVGKGVESILNSTGVRGSLIVASGGVILLTIGGFFIGGGSAWHVATIWVSLLAVCGFAAICLICWTVDRRRLCPVGILALLVVEMGTVGWSFWRLAPDSGISGDGSQLPPQLLEQGHRTYTEGSVRPLQVVISGMTVAEGLDPVQLSSYARYMAIAASCPPDEYSTSVPAFIANPDIDAPCANRQVNSRMLGRLAVDYALTSIPQLDPGWVLVLKEPGLYLYRNRYSQPLAYLAEGVIAVRNAAEAEAYLADDQVRGQVTAINGRALMAISEIPGQVRSKWLSSDCVRIYAKTETESYLVLSVPYIPGWKATDDQGIDYEIYQTDLAIMGIYLPAGEREISFCYEPKGRKAGNVIGVSALLFTGLMALIIEGARRPHARSAHSVPGEDGTP